MRMQRGEGNRAGGEALPSQGVSTPHGDYQTGNAFPTADVDCFLNVNVLLSAAAFSQSHTHT